MSHPLNLQRGFSLPEVLVAMVLMVMIVTALSGYQRVLMHSFALRHQYLQIWRQAWQQTALYPFSPADDWKANRMQTTHRDVSASASRWFHPSGRQGQMTRLHCPNR